MAYTEIRRSGISTLPKEFIGPEGTEKPTEGVPNGSTFKEYNTENKVTKISIFTDDGWIEDVLPSTSTNTSPMEGFGNGTTLRPLATAVPIGYVWMDVTNQILYQSNGTTWVVI